MKLFLGPRMVYNYFPQKIFQAKKPSPQKVFLLIFKTEIKSGRVDFHPLTAPPPSPPKVQLEASRCVAASFK